MVDVEAVKFPVCGQVNAGGTLRVENDTGGINDSLLGGQGG